MHFDWGILGPENWERIRNFLIPGLLFSIKLTLVATFGGIFFGTLLALIRLSRFKIPALIVKIYVDFIRSIPLMMVLFFFYLGATALGPEKSAYITFIVFEATYFSEIVRAGIQSVPRAQSFASTALGMTYRQNMCFIVLPQAFRNMIPVFLTQIIVLFQDTSLVYITAGTDLLKGFEQIGGGLAGFRKVEAYILAAFVYFIICFTLSKLALAYQRRVAIIR